ncbi:MAG: hypothetical protein AAB459_04310 [Patescibacteria group bacterium]
MFSPHCMLPARAPHLERGADMPAEANAEQARRLPAFIYKTGAMAAIGGLAFGAFKLDMLPQIDWFDGGKSDKAPKGDVFYEGQTAETASTELMFEIGRGNAIVAAKAKQNHDKKGGLFSGDFQGTNGTSFVRDPDDHDEPAKLNVEMRYCAGGLIEKSTTKPHNGESQITAKFELGDIFVCDAILRHSEENDAAFAQDDTSAEFHGRFVSFVSGAVETQAKAAPCPIDELSEYTSTQFNSHLQSLIAGDLGIPISNVEIVGGKIGKSDESTKRLLKQTLDSYANYENPEDPSEILQDFDFQYLSGGGKPIEDSCFNDIGQVELSSLDNLKLDEKLIDGEEVATTN